MELQSLKDSKGNFSAFNVFDFIFLTGDLNFRITQKEVVIKQMIDKGEFNDLLKRDELYNLKLYHDQLKLYYEHDVGFKPSYKFKPKSSPLVYETSKDRMPSYCDRILYKPSKNIWSNRYD